MQPMTLDDCENIFDQALASQSEAEFCHAVEPLWKEYKILSIGLTRGSIFYRARLIESEFYKNLSEIDYPPPKYAKQGRLNDAGIPCFYVATSIETALLEVGATKDQLVQLAGFRINKESQLRIALIGEYANVQKNGYIRFAGKDPGMTITKILNAMPRQAALKLIYIDKFFASILADPNASNNGYMFSRALGKLIYSKIGAEGIVFPSVKDLGGFNIAVQAKPSDKCFLNVCCFVVRMSKPRYFGLTDYTITNSTERLDDKWNFIWKVDSDSEIIGIYNMTKEEFEAVSKNPGDRNNLLHMLRAST